MWNIVERSTKSQRLEKKKHMLGCVPSNPERKCKGKKKP